MEEKEMFQIINKDEIDEKKFEEILNEWKLIFEKKDFFDEASFSSIRMDATRTCKSKYGTLIFREGYFDLTTASKCHLLFHFSETIDKNNERIFILIVSHNEKSVCIEMKNEPQKLPVLLDDIFKHYGQHIFFEKYMSFWEKLETAEKNFNPNLDEREWV